MTQSNRSSDTPSPAAPKAAVDPPESGWVLAPGSEPYSREELLARYRRQRALPEDPFEQGGKPTPPAGYRDRIMSQPQPAARFVERAEAQASPAPQKRTLTLPQTFAIASAMALAGGAGVGMVNATLFSGAKTPEQIADTLTPVQASAGTVLSPAPVVQPRRRPFSPRRRLSSPRRPFPRHARSGGCSGGNQQLHSAGSQCGTGAAGQRHHAQDLRHSGRAPISPPGARTTTRTGR